MTEEEKKEFEEFLQWKAEKAKREALEKGSDSQSERSEEEDTCEVSNSDISQTPLPQDQDNNLNIIVKVLIAFVAFVFMFIILYTCNNTNRNMSSLQDSVGIDEDSIVEVDMVAPSSEITKKEWDFTIKKDAMTDTKNIWATIRSDNYISQDFPYEGYTYASITVRYMKKYGYDVLIEITKGQINGRSYSGTNYITARFDEGSPKKYYFNEAADGSSDIIFLRNQSDFIKKCKAAKDIKIDIPIYQGGRPVFSFHVDDPLVWREE